MAEQIKANRKQRRAKAAKDKKDVTSMRLIFVIIKHFEIIFNKTYWCNNEDGKENFKNFSPVFAKYARVETPKDGGEFVVINDKLLTGMSKKELLKLYSNTAKAAYYICQYHGLGIEVIGAK